MLAFPISVDYATSDGTAIAGDDYSNTSGSFTFDGTVLTQTVSVPLVNDGDSEGAETLTLTISNLVTDIDTGPNIIIGNSHATITIVDTQ